MVQNWTHGRARWTTFLVASGVDYEAKIELDESLY